MKISSKMKKKIKKRILVGLSSVSVILILFAVGKLTGFSIPFGKLTNTENYSAMTEQGGEYASHEVSNRLENTATTTYIYDADDLVAFRNNVNAGNSYSGKTVYLMQDIDLSTVCSATLGSWEPIGTYSTDLTLGTSSTGIAFAGTFDGNYHTISNLYIKSANYLYAGLFSMNNGVIKNTILSNVYIWNNRTGAPGSYVGGIAGGNMKNITNCGIESGTLVGENTTRYTDTWKDTVVGGIAGIHRAGVINGCYNKASKTEGYGYYSTSRDDMSVSYVGGITGFAVDSAQILNCYNLSSVYSRAIYSLGGGITGQTWRETRGTPVVTNCYNLGSVTGRGRYQEDISQIIGLNDLASVSNCYNKVDTENLQTYAVTLKNAYAYDVYNINNGYPVLTWQNERPVMELNESQEYIKVGEQLQLNVKENEKITPIIGGDYLASNFTWKSTNGDVATVDETGMVTGLSDGYTTIYAYHEESKMYAMCIINVAKGEAVPQVETGNGFTVFLKADGTVWAVGNNTNGQLGNGTTGKLDVLKQVKIDEITPLDKVQKIAVGSDHVLALTKEGKVYAWGINRYGQLGQYNYSASSYAKQVLATNRTDYLEGIIDISASGYSSIALDKDGNVYMWGNNKTSTNTYPVKVNIEKVIQVSMGDGHAGALTSEGAVWTWGQNLTGQLGINCLNNVSYPMKSALEVTELSLGGDFTIVKKVDNKVYGTGYNYYGQLAKGDNIDAKEFTEVKLPTKITDENKVKYVKAGIVNTTILLQDGTVWETGANAKGELGNGTVVTYTTDTEPTYTGFVQGLTADNTPIEEVIMIGRNRGSGVLSNPVKAVGNNTAVITKQGYIYITGDNTYGQINDNTTTNSLYYKKMGYIDLGYKEVEVKDEQPHQIDLQQLNYSIVNVYSDGSIQLDELKYDSSDEKLATVSEEGCITTIRKMLGTIKVRIEDINGYQTELIVYVNRLRNTDTTTYIYTAEELVMFRDSVNLGNDYKGKTIYLMKDIDLSTVCSETIGSWEPIGTWSQDIETGKETGTAFAGTFDGNYYTISNLYVNSQSYQYVGLFSMNNGIIKNTVLSNVAIYNYKNDRDIHTYAAAITAYNKKSIINCGVESGSIRVNNTVKVTDWRSRIAAGISAFNGGEINGCYNKASITAEAYYSASRSDLSEAFAGGIVGIAHDNSRITNCYNGGVAYSRGTNCYTGGIIGQASYDSGRIPTVTNCYNKASVSGKGRDAEYIDGIIGINGWTGTRPQAVDNCYSITDTEELQTYTVMLKNAYTYDVYNINDGYPVLAWQNERPVMELNKNQEYIKVAEQLQLKVKENETITPIIGGDYLASNFTWKSTNEEVATVDDTGMVTGLSDGYTTIYAYHEESKMYAMCIINVAKGEAVPQIETGNGFTVLLKADGTVWTIGNNVHGQLGDGIVSRDRPVLQQVKINKTTYLTDVIKISAGSDRCVALTKQGEVYTWGFIIKKGNAYYSTNYAGQVRDANGDVLEGIVDVSTGSYTSMALDKEGNVYVWGSGTKGEFGNNSIMTSEHYTKKVNIEKVVGISMGDGHAGALKSDGTVWTWGQNTTGQLGINCLDNTSYPMKSALEVTELSLGGDYTIIKKVDNKVYGTGYNYYGQLAKGDNINAKEFTEVKLPTKVTDENKVKYIKAGMVNTTLLLKDGTVWEAGANEKGQLGNGTNIASTEFVQGFIANNTPIEGVLIIGRNRGSGVLADPIKGVGINNAVITDDGYIYTTGDNSKGQIGDNSKIDSLYYKKMGYITSVIYPKRIEMTVGENRILTEEELKYIAEYVNVYKEDRVEVSLLNSTKSLDSNIATYENGTITAQNIGNTMLVVKQEEVFIQIPIKVLPKEASVVPDVKTGNNFTVTLKADGTVWTFGNNTNSELGLGNNENSNLPKQVEGLKDEVIDEIAVGTSHIMVLTREGNVYTWGLNNYGQLGVGNTRNSNIPQKVEIPESTALVEVIKETIVKIFANKNVSYAITQSGKVYAWGEGYGTSLKLLEKDYNIVDVSKTYALDIDGNIYNLGTNKKLEIAEKIKYISEGNTHTVFLSENGTAYAIGSNTYGQFGDGTKVSNNTNVVAIKNEDVSDVLKNIVKLEAGNGYTTAVLSDGKLLEWGSNSHGQLGTSEIEQISTVRENEQISKLLAETNENIMLMDVGTSHMGIALTDGNVYTWGAGERGQLGNGSNNDSAEMQKVGRNIIEVNTNNLLLSEGQTFDLTAEVDYFNILKDQNDDITYESKDEGVVSVNAITGKTTAIAQGTTVMVVKEKGTNNIAVIQVRVLPKGIIIEPQVSTNGSHTVTLKVDGTVWCYGNNTNGELGNGTTTYSDEPVQAIFPQGIKIIQIVAGENFSAALDSQGCVWTWGANNHYQLGNTSTGITKVPTKVSGLSNITKITAGTYSMLALDKNKEIYGWGLNANGELGIGSYTNKISKPIKAKYMADVIDIAVGKNHSIALKSTGEVFVTGWNGQGQLGNKDISIRKVDRFTKVEGLTNVARITATDSGNIVSTINGEVYSWGLNQNGELGLTDKNNVYQPMFVHGVENIVQVSGGKNHSILLDKTGKVYTTGFNNYGQLGQGIMLDASEYTQIQKLEDVMTISAGNTYTVIAKEDGTVWGFGDYNHGDIAFKSKTNSAVPMQVGNDSFGLGVIKITVKKNESVDITKSLSHSFNLIYKDTDIGNLTYQSVNEEIASVNAQGQILGIREGFTWIKAIEEDGTEHVVYVYVTDSGMQSAPSVSAGEDFASVLKGDGSIWTFGHNNNGELGIGSNQTKDIPEKVNAVSSFKEMQAGENFTVAIKNDGTVWSYGKNNYGQLGIGNTKDNSNPVQMNGIGNIVQIAIGKEHGVAVDDYGILYGWGRNHKGQLGLNHEIVLTPARISYTNGTIHSIWAGEDETVVINTRGQVYGYGSILNGKLEGIENAVKVSVGNGYMLILTASGEVYHYNGMALTKYTGLAKIVDIDVTNGRNMAQTANEKVYTWTRSSSPVLESMENVYTIATGVNDSYVILTDGTVYAKGQNQYGQLGNSTREDSLTEFTLVGDRKIKVDPETKVMYVNDVEVLTEEVEMNEFNVFNRPIRTSEEYTWASNDANIVAVDKGKLTAMAEGTAEITITDDLTGANTKLTRIVIPVEKDRIESIKVDNKEATVKAEYTYYVEIETKRDEGMLQIVTKDKTDKISIDNGITWYEKGTLATKVKLLKDENEIPIIVETSNGTQIPYTLIVKKMATDVSLESIMVDGIQAIPTSSKNYEIVVTEETDISEIVATANSNKAKVSVNGEAYATWRATTEIEYRGRTSVILPVFVLAENGDEVEYILTIYKTSAILQLESLTVDGKEAIKTSETVYSITVEKDLTSASVTAKAVSELVKVAINNENAKVQISTKTVNITGPITEVQIRLSIIVNDEEVYKDYTLNIYKNMDNRKIQFVMVNGTVLMPKTDGTYEIYLPAETKNATVRVIAENAEDYVQIDENEKEKGETTVIVETPDNTNEYSIKVIDESTGDFEEYKLYIKKPSVDITLKEITVSNGDDKVIASKSTEEENVYIAKVKSYNDYIVTATTMSINAYVGIDDNEYTKHINSKVITKTDDYMEILIRVQVEDEDFVEYKLKIYIMSSDTSLEFIKVNEVTAKKQEDGSYLVNLDIIETKVLVEAQTTDKEAHVKVEEEAYELHTTTKDVMIDAKDTTTYIYVQAEDGTVEKHKLIISGLPDDSTLQRVVVNGVEANYIEGQNKYEIRLDSETFNIEAVATDSLAKVALNGGEETVASATTTINREGEITTVTIKVMAQNGVDSTEYTLEISEKSSDTSIATVVVNDKKATKLEDGNYTANVASNVEEAVIKIETNDEYAIVYLDDETQNADNVTVTKQITQRETIYNIKIVAEDGTEEKHTLTITRLENNTIIKELSVITTMVKENESTGEITTTEKTDIVELQEDGTYYWKIDRVENLNVKAVLEDKNASVKIENSSYVLTQTQVNVDTTEEITIVNINVKAEDGTIQNYTLKLEKKSNDTNISYIKVGENILAEYDETTNTYRAIVKKELTTAKVEVKAVSEVAKIAIKEDEQTGLITGNIALQGKVTSVKIAVTAEDGTQKEYTLEIYQGMQIKGIIETENYEGKHKATVSLYQAGEEETAIQEVTTNEDGSFVIVIEEPGNYDIKVTKVGYLSYKVSNIEVLSEDMIELEKYKLLAGDVKASGEIEIADLVALNDNYGVVITDDNKETKAIYDLNEDGAIDRLDRNILKANYGKKAETVTWINPKDPVVPGTNGTDPLVPGSNGTDETLAMSLRSTRQDFILPILCDYKITSEYGTRVHPMTGEEKRHTGIDIAGTWHTEVMAVADGEVTFVGVNTAFGNCVEIKHMVNGKTIYSFYAHLSRINVKVGEKVTQGQVIGLEGGNPEVDPNPGYSTGHHLHFEIRTASGYGNDVDPNDYIKF